MYVALVDHSLRVLRAIEHSIHRDPVVEGDGNNLEITAANSANNSEEEQCELADNE
jgi:hypothetical protein